MCDLTVTSADSIVQGVLRLSGNELRKAEKVKKTGIVPRSDRERMQRLLDAKVQHVQPNDDHFRKLPKEKRLKLANAEKILWIGVCILNIVCVWIAIQILNIEHILIQLNSEAKNIRQS